MSVPITTRLYAELDYGTEVIVLNGRLRGLYGNPHLDTQRLNLIKDHLFRELHNEEFAQQLESDLKTESDYMYESSQTQNGKTKVILTSAWYLKFFHERLPIIMTDNSNVDIMQLVARANEFDNNIRRILHQHNLTDEKDTCLLGLKEIKANTPVDTLTLLARDKNAFISSIQKDRYRNILKLAEVSVERPLAFIYDEADISVGKYSSDKESIFREMMEQFGPRSKNIYITATSFAVMNSSVRSEIRTLIHRRLPDSLYEGLEYRGYDHPSNVRITAEWVSELAKNPLEWSPETIRDILAFLRETIRETRLPSQPCIILINVINENSIKHDIARTLCYMLIHHPCHIIVYTGNGIEVYGRDGTIVKKVETYIGAYLQKLKDERFNDPILIISTRKASRSQTYKSADNGWKLTHFVLNLPKSSHMESVIQSLRPNGQYRPIDPRLKMWVSSKTHELIMNSLVNKQTLSAYFCLNRHDRTHRETITTTPLLKKAPPMTRKELLDVKMNKRGSHGYVECMNLPQARLHAEWYRDTYYPGVAIIEVTDYHTIPMAELVERFPVIETTLQESEPFIRFHEEKGLQTNIRRYILEVARERFAYDQDDAKVQIAYSTPRETTLNKVDYEKKENYRADITALSPGNRLFVPIVIYRTRVFQDRAIYIWHGTDGRVRFHARGGIDLPEFGLLQRKVIPVLPLT